MKSTIDILSAVHYYLDPIMKSKISGSVLVGHAQDNDQLENVTLNCLTNPGTYVQNGFMNINIELMEVEKGVANMVRFKEILDDLMPLVEDESIDYGGTSVQLYLDDDKGVFKSEEQTGKYFYNLRVAFAAL